MGWFEPLDALVLAEVRELARHQAAGFYRLDENDRLILEALREIVGLLAEIRDTLKPRLSSLLIRFGGNMPATVEVGKSIAAVVIGFDQNGQPFDLTGQTPSWSTSDAGIATVAPPDQLTTSVTGVAAGSANLSVTVGGLSASDVVTVTAPAPVLTSVVIQFPTT